MPDGFDYGEHLKKNFAMTPEMVEAFWDDMTDRGLCIKFPEPVALDSPECVAAHDLLARKN